MKIIPSEKNLADWSLSILSNQNVTVDLKNLQHEKFMK